MTAPEHSPTLAGIRMMMLVILLLGLLGAGAELLFLGHTEGVLQWIPVALISAGLLVAWWHLASNAPASLYALRVVMIAFVASGVLGVVLHYRGSVEFQKDVDPTIAGLDLFMKVMNSKAPPALAPGLMAHLGLLGLVYTYRHPYLESNKKENP